jgi:hypothetical protein
VLRKRASNRQANALTAAGDERRLSVEHGGR